MSRFEEKVRIKQLLVDAITLLCRNGMQFENKFCIEALIAITLDDRDVVLVNINETIGNPESGCTDARSEPSENASKSVKTRTKTVKKEASREDVAQSSEDPLTNFDSNSYYDHGNFVGLNSSAYNSSDDQNSGHNIKYEELDEGNNYDRPHNNDDVERANLVSEDGNNADDCYFVKTETLDENADSQGWSNMNVDPAYNGIEHNVLNPPNTYFYQAAPHRKSRVREKSVMSKSNWRSSTARIGRPRHSSTVLQDQDLAGLTGDIGLRCNYCCLNFTASQSLREHIKAVHFQMKMFPCKFCGEAFKWRSGLRKHRQMFCPFTVNDPLDPTNVANNAN